MVSWGTVDIIKNKNKNIYYRNILKIQGPTGPEPLAPAVGLLGTLQVPKKCWSTFFWVNIFFWSIKNVGIKMLVLKKFWSKKMLVKKNLVKIFFGNIFFLVKHFFWSTFFNNIRTL